LSFTFLTALNFIPVEPYPVTQIQDIHRKLSCYPRK